MSNVNNKQRLKKLVESIVSEEIEKPVLLTEGDDVIYKAFIEPFKDVADTAIHGLKKVASTGVSDLWKVVKMTFMSMLPFVGPAELDNIEAEADQRLDKYMSGLDSEYQDVLQRNVDALGTRDAKYFSFFLRPDLFFARQFATGAPLVALDFLETLTSGNDKVTALKNKVADIHATKNPAGAGGGPMSGGTSGGYIDGDDGGYMQEEAANPQQAQQDQKLAIKKEIQALMTDPSVIQSMKDSPIIKGVANSKVQAVLKRAHDLNKAQTFDQVKKFIGSKGPEIEKKVLENLPPETTPEQQQELLDAQVPEVKKMFKGIYKSYLTDFLKMDSFYKKDVQTALGQLEQLG